MPAANYNRHSETGMALLEACSTWQSDRCLELEAKVVDVPECTATTYERAIRLVRSMDPHAWKDRTRVRSIDRFYPSVPGVRFTLPPHMHGRRYGVSTRKSAVARIDTGGPHPIRFNLKREVDVSGIRLSHRDRPSLTRHKTRTRVPIDSGRFYLDLTVVRTTRRGYRPVYSHEVEVEVARTPWSHGSDASELCSRLYTHAMTYICGEGGYPATELAPQRDSDTSGDSGHAPHDPGTPSTSDNVPGSVDRHPTMSSYPGSASVSRVVSSLTTYAPRTT